MGQEGRSKAGRHDASWDGCAGIDSLPLQVGAREVGTEWLARGEASPAAAQVRSQWCSQRCKWLQKVANGRRFAGKAGAAGHARNSGTGRGPPFPQSRGHVQCWSSAAPCRKLVERFSNPFSSLLREPSFLTATSTVPKSALHHRQDVQEVSCRPPARLLGPDPARAPIGAN